MKKFLGFVVTGIVVLLASIGSPAQEKFDIVSFKAPSGWQKSAGEDAIQFSKQEGTEVGIMMLFRSVSTDKSPRQTFDASWESIVRGLFDKVDAPQMQPAAEQSGWTIENGSAVVEKTGTEAVANLISATGSGKVVNLLIIYNSESFQPAVDSFIASIVLPKLKATDGADRSSLSSSASNEMNAAEPSGSISAKYSCLKLVSRNGTSVYEPAGLGFAIRGNSYSVVGGTGGKVVAGSDVVEFFGGRLNGYRGERRNNNGKPYIFFRVKFTEVRPNDSIKFGDMQCYRQ